MEFSDVRAVALAAARDAAAIHQRHLGRLRPEDWSLKGTADFVSFVDREAEACIIERIRSAFPTHAIMAEESFSENDPDLDWRSAEWLWLVDPLDGTTNFLHGYPAYCASVAVTHRGAVAAGAVVCGPTGEEWCAVRHGGATRNGAPIHVSGVDQLGSALVGTGFPFRYLELLPRYLQQFDAVVRCTSGVRRAGSAALDLCHVATGYFDGFWELNLNPWDTAAGSLVIHEAGGLITRMGQDLDLLRPGPVLAGNPVIHADLLALLRSVS